jgi:hypothetical protein
LFSGLLLEPQRPPDRLSNDPHAVDLGQRLRSGEDVCLADTLIEKGADGDRGDVARVDWGRCGIAVGSTDDPAVDDLVFPGEVVGHERVGAHIGPRQPGRGDGPFKLQVLFADSLRRGVCDGR